VFTGGGFIRLGGWARRCLLPTPRHCYTWARRGRRPLPGLPALNSGQSIPLRDVIDAYTVNGAEMLYLKDVAGSLEAGKSADFIVLDRDILALADSGRAAEVADTKVLATWFRGDKVYTRALKP
jgi:predicted amidohydrolase YtcJ